jgi:Tfp pilus assembly protein PilX
MKHRGVALLTGLVLLAALSLLALVSAKGMVEQRQLAGNFESRRLALENARLAEATARWWLFSRADVERQAACTTNCLLPVAILNAGQTPDHPEFESIAWWRSNGHLAGVHPETGDPVAQSGTGAEPARWLLEEIHYGPATPDADAGIGGIGYYRVLARGTGSQAGSVAATEAIVARPWGSGVVPAPFPPSAESAPFCSQFGDEQSCGMTAWRQLR